MAVGTWVTWSGQPRGEILQFLCQEWGIEYFLTICDVFFDSVSIWIPCDPRAVTVILLEPFLLGTNDPG